MTTQHRKPDLGSDRRLIGVTFGTAVFAALVVWLLVGRDGFNPTDEGLVLAQARRVLDGQSPHRDFITPRPAGSAIVHMVDMLLPGPTFLVSRAVSVGQVMLAAAAFVIVDQRVAATTGQRRPGAHTVAAAVAIVAGLINLHTFPLMAWHTVDGIFFTAIGVLLIERPPRRAIGRSVIFGLVLLGAAATMKQSFALSPVLGIVLAATAPTARRPRIHLVLLVSAAFAPMLLYVGWMMFVGGFDAALDQLLGARAVLGDNLVRAITSNGWWPPFLVVSIWAAVALTARRRTGHSVTRTAPVAAGCAGLSMAIVVVNGGLELGGWWGVVLFWSCAATVLACTIVDGRVDRIGCVLLVVGWMTSLSWGYDVPNLVAGSLTAAAGFRLVRLATGSHVRGRTYRGLRARPAGTVAVAMVAVAALGWFVTIRGSEPYRDDPHDLVAGMGASSAELRGLRTNPVTAQFVREVRECLARYPAARMSVVPDGAAFAPALGVDAALPIDWMWPPEYDGQQERLLDATARLSDAGDYLVLFQTVPADVLADLDGLPTAKPGDPVFSHRGGIEPDVLAALDGVRASCGSFVVVVGDRVRPPASGD